MRERQGIGNKEKNPVILHFNWKLKSQEFHRVCAFCCEITIDL